METVIGNLSRGTLGKRSASPLRHPESWCPWPRPMMSVPALALCVDLTIDTPCAAVAERVKRRHSHVAKRMRSRSSRRFVAVSGSPSYERQTLRRSFCSTSTLKAHQYLHSLMYAGLLLSLVLFISASCTLLSMSVMSAPPTMSMSFVSSSSSSAIRRRRSGVGPVGSRAACAEASRRGLVLVRFVSVLFVRGWFVLVVCVVWHDQRPRRGMTCRGLLRRARRGS